MSLPIYIKDLHHLVQIYLASRVSFFYLIMKLYPLSLAYVNRKILSMSLIRIVTNEGKQEKIQLSSYLILHFVKISFSSLKLYNDNPEDFKN